MSLVFVKESEIDNKPWGGQFSCSIRLHRLNKLKTNTMKEVTRDEYLAFYTNKENIKGHAKKIGNVMYYNVFHNGILIARSEEKDLEETKYYINDKQS